jgi:hypothetical protein
MPDRFAWAYAPRYTKIIVITTFGQLQDLPLDDRITDALGGPRVNRTSAFIAAITLLVGAGTANAREAIRLTDTELRKITAGTAVAGVPIIASLLTNGSSGVSQFSPAVATLVPTITSLNICVFCVTTLVGGPR